VAQKIRTLFIDDLDGSAAEGTVRFGLDGTEYEIDLNAGHAKELRDALARYVDAARRVARGRRGAGGRRVVRLLGMRSCNGADGGNLRGLVFARRSGFVRCPAAGSR